jgi:enoyl-CoA hydratase/carnithine racemase
MRPDYITPIPAAALSSRGWSVVSWTEIGRQKERSLMAYEFLIYEKKGHVAYITINRPERMNALHPPAHPEFWEVWCDFRDDPEMWVAVLTGAGEKAFSAGNDLRYQAESAGKPRIPGPPGGFGGITNRFECYKPMIAAVNGYALGGGLEMALACDIIIAADHARLGLPEPTVGLNAGAGGIHRLPRHLPLKVAMGMLLTARHITAQEAYRIGLVNEVVPLSELWDCVDRWVQEILRCAPLSIRSTKEGALKGLSMPLEVAMNHSFPLSQAMAMSEDFTEGPRAFAEKRAPNWKGR